MVQLQVGGAGLRPWWWCCCCYCTKRSQVGVAGCKPLAARHHLLPPSVAAYGNTCRRAAELMTVGRPWALAYQGAQCAAARPTVPRWWDDGSRHLSSWVKTHIFRLEQL